MAKFTLFEFFVCESWFLPYYPLERYVLFVVVKEIIEMFVMFVNTSQGGCMWNEARP